MSYKVYTERYIRTKIISKAQPVIKKSRSPHDIGKIMVDGKHVTSVKIPNGHKSEFRSSKARQLAKQLCLDANQYNQFMDCPMKHKEYYEVLRKTKI